MKVSIYPKFDSIKIVDEWIGQDWFRFQNLVNILGDHLLNYMQTYINARSHREGRTGNLANSIKKYDLPNTGIGEASVGWGIGLISEMDKLAPYWYLINYGGKTFVANFGMGVGGYFGAGDAPDSSKAGTGIGTQRFTQEYGQFVMYPKNPIKGINYIESTRQKLDQEIRKIIDHLKHNK